MDFGLQLLHLSSDRSIVPEMELRWSTVLEMEELLRLLVNNRRNGALLKGIFAVVGGDWFCCGEYDDASLQISCYERYKKQRKLQIYLFPTSEGEPVRETLNIPGQWHQNKLACLSGLTIFRLSDKHTLPGLAILRDSAFVTYSRTANVKNVRARKSNETQSVPESDVRLCFGK